MKFGMRTPSIKKSIKAKTTGKAKRAVKKALIPGYGKKVQDGLRIQRKQLTIKFIRRRALALWIYLSNYQEDYIMERVAKFLKEAETYVSFYKSIVDQDRASVVICNLKHEIIYMNPAAVTSYAKRGGDKLIGRSLLDCHSPESRNKIQQVVDWFAADESHNIVYTFHNEKQNKDVYMVALRDESKLIGYYEKHEYRNSETMKPYNLW